MKHLLYISIHLYQSNMFWFFQMGNSKEAKNTNGMFYGCKKFNQDLSSWDLKYIYDFEYMLHDTPIQNDKSKHPKILNDLQISFVCGAN